MNVMALIVFLGVVLSGLAFASIAVYWILLHPLLIFASIGIIVLLYLLVKQRKALSLLTREAIVYVGGIILVISILTLIFELIQPNSKSGCFIMGIDRCSE